MTTALVPSSQRPVPLEHRKDLRAERIDYRGVGSWVVKDPVGLRYNRLEPEQYAVLQLLDGERSLEEIRDELQVQFPTDQFRLTDVQRLVTELHTKGLLQGKRWGQGEELLKKHRAEARKKLLSQVRNLLYVRLPGWDPEPVLARMYPFASWMFHPATLVFSVTLLLSSWILLAVRFDQFRAMLPEFQQFFGWPNLIYLWATLGLAKIIHEFAHGLSCKHYGGECHEMGVMLLVFSPCMYCDVSDSWMLKNKWQRIAIGGAGMVVEMVISAIAIFAWWNTRPGLLNYLCLNLFFVTTATTVIFNANPLMRFDGYFMLSDWLEIPNLRPKADKLLREKFAWYCLGIEMPPDRTMPETGRGWFVAYAVAAAVYRWIILFGILLFLYTVLKPYGLQSIGITLAVVSIGGIVFNMLKTVYDLISAPRSEPMSVRKITATLVILLALVGGALAVPLPLHVESAFLIEPKDVRHIYTSTPGRLTKLDVQPGQQVAEDQLLALLQNEDKEDAYRELLVNQSVQETEIALYRALDDAAQEQLAIERLQSIREQLADFERQLQQLTIEAPVTGTVVAPPRVPEPALDVANLSLKKWHGTPLDPENFGCFLEHRTHLLSVAPSDQLEAILVVDQANRNDVAVGQEVELKFDHLADKTYTATIEEISDRHLEFAPPALSNKMGGELATVTDSDGRERLTSIAYQATVTLPSDTHLLKPGMRGRARFVVDRRSAAEWIWRYLRRTFHFRL